MQSRIMRHVCLISRTYCELCNKIYVLPLERTDDRREKLKGQTCQIVQYEAIARDGRKAHQRYVSGRTDAPLPPYKKADKAWATDNNQRAGPCQRHTDVDERYCGCFQLLPEAEIRTLSCGRVSGIWRRWVTDVCWTGRRFWICPLRRKTYKMRWINGEVTRRLEETV